MCMCCSAKARTIKKDILPGYDLVIATVDVVAYSSELSVMTREGVGLSWPKGWYALQRWNDPDIIFEHKPAPDPLQLGKLSANTHPKEFEAWKKWAENAEITEKSLTLPAYVGYLFVRACKKAGYRNRDGRLSFWLVDYLGRQLKRKARSV